MPIEDQSAKKLGGSKLDEYPDAFTRWVNGERQGPLAIEVTAAGGCNHGCLHCGYQQYVPFEQHKTYIDRERFISFMHDFAELGGKEIFFAGKGEPLLNPDIHEYCKVGSSLGIDMVMSTNGILMVEKRIQNLMSYMKWIRFSVNGGNREAYARIHRCDPSDFDRLERNLSIACKVRDRDNLRVKLAIQLVLYDKNLDSAQGVIELFKRVGADFLFIRNVIDSDGRFATVPKEAEIFLKSIDDPPRIQVRWGTFLNLNNERKWSICHGINFHCTMDQHGNIGACLRDLVAPSIYGNIHDKSFKHIWLSEERNKMAAEISTGNWIPMCGKWCDVSGDNIYVERHLVSHNQ